MSAGELRHLVSLQSPVSTVDDIGQPSTAWATVASPRASITYQNATEAIKSGTDASVTRVVIKIRHRSVNAGQRVLHNSISYAILGVQPDVRKAYVYLTCEVINGAT